MKEVANMSKRLLLLQCIKEMLDHNINTNLNVMKLDYKNRFAYVSEIWDLIPDVIRNSDIIFLYGKKNAGKSTIGYNLIAECLNSGKNAVYGRLQMKEKDNALGDIIRVMKLKYNIELSKVRGFGSSILYVDGDIKKPYIRFVSMGDYQMTRSTVNENTGLIFFDEINANKFDNNFIDNLINTISTLARDNQIKFYGCGNNETAQNNPIFSMLQIALDWSYKGLQIANRIINGANCTVIQCGGDIFNQNRPITLSERLGSNIDEYANKYLYGINLDSKSKFILNVPEFITHKIPQLIIGDNQYTYLFSKCQIKDTVNNNFVNNGWYVERVINPSSYDVPKYAVDYASNLYYKTFTLLDDPSQENLLKQFYFATKNNTLYFKDFDTKDCIFKLFSFYHLEQPIKELNK